MPSAVHTFIIDKNAENVKKSDRKVKFFYFCLSAVKHLWNKEVKFVTAYKHSCLPQTIDKVRFTGNVADNRFVMW